MFWIINKTSPAIKQGKAISIVPPPNGNMKRIAAAINSFVDIFILFPPLR